MKIVGNNSGFLPIILAVVIIIAAIGTYMFLKDDGEQPNEQGSNEEDISKLSDSEVLPILYSGIEKRPNKDCMDGEVLGYGNHCIYFNLGQIIATVKPGQIFIGNGDEMQISIGKTNTTAKEFTNSVMHGVDLTFSREWSIEGGVEVGGLIEPSAHLNISSTSGWSLSAYSEYLDSVSDTYTSSVTEGGVWVANTEAGKYYRLSQVTLSDVIECISFDDGGEISDVNMIYRVRSVAIQGQISEDISFPEEKIKMGVSKEDFDRAYSLYVHPETYSVMIESEGTSLEPLVVSVQEGGKVQIPSQYVLDGYQLYGFSETSLQQCRGKLTVISKNNLEGGECNSSKKYYAVWVPDSVYLSDPIEDYTLVYNEESLANVGKTGKYLLVNDISLVNPWKPIPYFKGSFEGAGHTISNLHFYGTAPYNDGAYRFGLFNLVDGGEIKNLNVDVNITHQKIQGKEDERAVYIGGIAADAYNGSIITNCSVSGSISKIRESDKDGALGKLYVGGIVGKSYLTTVSSCVNYAKIVVRGWTTAAGGICGFDEKSSISYSANHADVIAMGERTSYAGGIAGWMVDCNDSAALPLCRITNCVVSDYIIASHMGNSWTHHEQSGAIAGQNDNSYITMCSFENNRVYEYGGDASSWSVSKLKSSASFQGDHTYDGRSGNHKQDNCTYFSWNELSLESNMKGYLGDKLICGNQKYAQCKPISVIVKEMKKNHQL